MVRIGKKGVDIYTCSFAAASVSFVTLSTLLYSLIFAICSSSQSSISGLLVQDRNEERELKYVPECTVVPMRFRDPVAEQRSDQHHNR